MKDLIRKYYVPGPRYTSYPTVPFWKNDGLPRDQWLESIIRNFDHFKSEEISLYIHLPYCENLCTFCGCHKRITKNLGVEEPYIDTLLREWSLYLERLPFQPRIKELHFGGGTPTFFKADELIRLLTGLFYRNEVDPGGATAMSRTRTCSNLVRCNADDDLTERSEVVLAELEQ